MDYQGLIQVHDQKQTISVIYGSENPGMSYVIETQLDQLLLELL